jgi:hypothetical protein
MPLLGATQVPFEVKTRTPLAYWMLWSGPWDEDGALAVVVDDGLVEAAQDARNAPPNASTAGQRLDRRVRGMGEYVTELRSETTESAPSCPKEVYDPRDSASASSTVGRRRANRATP